MQPEVQIDASIRARLRAIALEFHGVRVDGSGEAYAELCELALALKREHGGASAGAIEAAAESRRLYREFGIDPTRTRPSSEALLRRALRGLELYRISNVVDAGNFVSLRWQLSLGLYDSDRIVGPLVTLRTGQPGEGYEGIRKAWVNVGDRLCAADSLGAFGSPTSDSARACIGEGSERVLVVVFAPADGDMARLLGAAAELTQAMQRHAGARLADRRDFL